MAWNLILLIVSFCTFVLSMTIYMSRAGRNIDAARGSSLPPRSERQDPFPPPPSDLQHYPPPPLPPYDHRHLSPPPLPPGRLKGGRDPGGSPPYGCRDSSGDPGGSPLYGRPGPGGIRPIQFPRCPIDRQRNRPGQAQKIFWNGRADCYICSNGHRIAKNGKLC